MPPPKAESHNNKDAGNANPNNTPPPRNTRAGRENSSKRSEASTVSQTRLLNDPCRDEGLDTHAENVKENGPTAPEDYAYNRELAIREGASDYWRDAIQTPTATCLNCGRLITEPWWTTLLVPEAVLSRRPLCSSVCLLEYCSNQKWNAGTLEMPLDYPGVFGKLKLRRDTIRLDIPQDQLRAQLDKLHKDQLRPQLEKLHALATRQVTPTLLSEWGFQPWTETVSPERAGRAAKRPHEGVTLTRNTKPKSAPSRIRASPVTEATAPKLQFLKAVNAARTELPPACPAVPKSAPFHQSVTGHRRE